MTFARQALQYVEVDLDTCANTFGVLPCTASIDGSPPTGTDKCFNSKATCQVVADYINDPVTLRFAVPTSYLPWADIEAVASIKDINFDPPTLSLGENLGQRATLTVTFTDHKDSDTGPGGDPYFAERDYNPWEQGTYWGKFRARHPYLRGRPLRWITGFLGDALADMTTRHFVIESFSGPTPQGVYTLVAKDVLKLADGDRALAPAVSNGFLAADINASTTSASLSPTGIGNLEYPASGYVAIGGNEICAFTREGHVLTLTRGQLGTTAAAHSAGDRAQLVLRYVAQDPADIIADLYETYAGVPSAYVPIAQWQAETATFFNALFTATIANPTSVNTLISEIIAHGMASWWRDSAQTIGLQVLRGIDTSAALFDESNYLADSLKIQEQPEKRASKVLTYFGQINPLTSLTDAANFRSVAVEDDADAEEDYGSAAIQVFYSRWIPAGGGAIADRRNALVLSRFRDPPRKFSFSVLRGSNAVEPELAQGFRLTATAIQDAFGAAEEALIEVTRVNPGPDVVAIEAEEMLYLAPADEDRSVIIDFNVSDYNLRTAHDLLYSAPVSGDVVNLLVPADVVISASSTSVAALNIGSWPAGVTINVEILGTIRGAGGQGGRGGSVSVGEGGWPGGVALYTRHAISLTAAVAKIWGGGGGGGGGGGAVGLDPVSGDVRSAGGGGGGGGRGIVAGQGNYGGQTVDSPGQSGHTGTADAPGGAAVGGVFGANIIVGGISGIGGEIGQAGQSGNTGSTGSLAVYAGGLGGAAGAAIDGVSYVTLVTGPGSIVGPQIN